MNEQKRTLNISEEVALVREDDAAWRAREQADRIRRLPEHGATASRDEGRGYSRAVRDVLDILQPTDAATDAPSSATAPSVPGHSVLDCHGECLRHGGTGRPPVPYDREALVLVITYHRKVDIKGCMCGWAELGKDHSKHVANVYEQTVRRKP